MTTPHTFNVSILLVRQVQILDGELPVPESHDDRPLMRFHSPVDDDPVAIEDASILHRVALHVAIERSLRMAYVVAVEVQRLVHIVFCRTGESRPYASVHQFQFGVEHPFLYLDSTNHSAITCNISQLFLHIVPFNVSFIIKF